MTLVDTSVWVDFFAGRSSPHVATLEALIVDEDICLCGVVLTEILQGIRDDKDYRATRRYLEPLTILPMTSKTFIAAADLYRLLRRRGVTVRKPIDCMIAATAIEHGVELLQNDRDFAGIARHCELTLTAYRP